MTNLLEATAANLTARIANLMTCKEADTLADELEADIVAIKTAFTSTAHGAEEHDMVELLKEAIHEVGEAHTDLQYEAYLGELEADRLGEQYA
jgi:hypothetical protein